MNTLEYIKKRFGLELSRPQPLKIDSFGRTELAKVFAELDFKNGAEIGVDRGFFSEELCLTNPQLQLFSIDPWSTSAFENPISSSQDMQPIYEVHYQRALTRLSKYNCKIIREGSLSALNDFEDESLDFVYIDANHNFVTVAEDIYRWQKKVKIGGIVSGHDYEHYPPSQDNHVKHVVDAYVQAFEIPYYFELGQDKHHSWFWVK